MGAVGRPLRMTATFNEEPRVAAVSRHDKYRLLLVFRRSAKRRKSTVRRQRRMPAIAGHAVHQLRASAVARDEDEIGRVVLLLEPAQHLAAVARPVLQHRLIRTPAFHQELGEGAIRIRHLHFVGAICMRPDVGDPIASR